MSTVQDRRQATIIDAIEVACGLSVGTEIVGLEWHQTS